MKAIRKLVLSLSAMLVAVNAFAYQFTDAGSLNTDANRHRQLLWVYNADNVTHEVGTPIVWHKGTVADGLEISTTTTANDPLVAGVVAERDLLAATWGFILVHGYCSNVAIGVANSAGDNLVTSTTGEKAGVYSVAQATGTAANQSNAFGVFAVAIEATTSSTTVKCIILR